MQRPFFAFFFILNYTTTTTIEIDICILMYSGMTSLKWDVQEKRFPLPRHGSKQLHGDLRWRNFDYTILVIISLCHLNNSVFCKHFAAGAVTTIL